jgi:hypothetical protein
MFLLLGKFAYRLLHDFECQRVNVHASIIGSRWMNRNGLGISNFTTTREQAVWPRHSGDAKLELENSSQHDGELAEPG